MRREMRKLILRLLIVVFACAISVFAYYAIPKSQTLSLDSQHVGYYRGFGMHGGKGFFGKNWCKIVVRDAPGGWWEVVIDDFGYNQYRGYYDDGRLREEGTILVFENFNDIAADRHDVQNGVYYDPNGNVVSTVNDGTGRQVICCSNGTIFWDLELKDGNYVQLKKRDCNGQLIHTSTYTDGIIDGKYLSYYPNGHVRTAGEYKVGQKIGVWSRFDENGTLISEEKYD